MSGGYEQLKVWPGLNIMYLRFVKLTLVQTNADYTIAIVNFVPIIRATSASLPARICTDSLAKKTVASLFGMHADCQKSNLCIVLVRASVAVG